jgi:gamma-glutamyltranspeptidase
MMEGDYMEMLRNETSDDTTLPLSRYGGKKWAQLKDTDGVKNVSDAKEGDRRRLLDHFGYLNDQGTSHFSIVDQDGNAVAMTTSVNTYFGCGVVSKSTGVILGNTMADFANPGGHSFFGLHPSEANFVKPGKKPLSSMSPTLVFQKTSSTMNTPDVLDELVLVIGASGGPKIITSVLQVLLRVIMIGRPLYDAVVHPRLHDQLIYNGGAVTAAEKAPLLQGPVIDLSQRTRDALLRRNHTLLDVDYMGAVQAVAIDAETGLLTAASDVRKGGTPAGY